jgi:hypothetical protein
MSKRGQHLQELPVNIVGSTVFGRYPKISVEQTFNMIISDDFLVPYAGYKQILSLSSEGSGRGIFNSSKVGKMFVVINSNIYSIDANLNYQFINTIDTTTGDVFIDENDNNQIAFCDRDSMYIYNYSTGDFQKAALDFIPGYVCFQDGYFIAPDINSARWELSALNNGLSWPAAPNQVGGFQTKPDNPVACVRLPGKGNSLLVMGKTVTEHWVDVGYQLFPYQRTSGYNIDYGCLSPATIAYGDNFVIWLGINEKSGPVIMYSSGGEVQQISNDGINFKFAQLTKPEDSSAFLFKQDGHLIYQITFKTDNFSLIFDFNTKKFFTLCDDYMNYHIAKKVVFFNNTYYFISFNDGNLYELNTKYTANEGKEIPRVRVTNSIRLPDSSQFIINNLEMVIEEGTDALLQRVDLSISTDGGVSFGNIVGQDLNKLGKRHNRLVFWNLGLANEVVYQARFWATGRFVVGNGATSIYQ